MTVCRKESIYKDYTSNPFLRLQVMKTFFKMLKDVGMAMPKTTDTRCRDDSVQARYVIQ